MCSSRFYDAPFNFGHESVVIKRNIANKSKQSESKQYQQSLCINTLDRNDDSHIFCNGAQTKKHDSVEKKRLSMMKNHNGFYAYTAQLLSDIYT